MSDKSEITIVDIPEVMSEENNSTNNTPDVNTLEKTPVETTAETEETPVEITTAETEEPAEENNTEEEIKKSETVEVTTKEQTEEGETGEDMIIVDNVKEVVEIPEEETAGEGTAVASTVIEVDSEDILTEEKRLEEEPAAGVISMTIENQLSINTSPLSEEINNIVDDGLAKMVSRYLDDDHIDNDELLDLVQYAMELAERRANLTGIEKKQVSMIILRQFMEKRVNNWDELEKLISKAVDFGIDVSRNGIQKIKITSNVISESKTAFNLIYSSTMSRINTLYPSTDDIINNLFDIAKHIVEFMEGQTSLTENEKKVLIKKVMRKVINSLSMKLTTQQTEFALQQVEPTVALIMIGLRAQSGQFVVNVQEVSKVCACLKKIFTRNSKKKK